MKSKSKTSLGVLYDPLEKLGESIILDLELYDSKDQLIETFSSSHAVNDGLSLLYEAINKKFGRDWKIPLGNLDSKNRNLKDKSLQLLKALNRKQDPNVDFRFNTAAQPSKLSAKRRLKVEAALGHQIEEFCRLKKVSVNSFLATAVFKTYSQIFGFNNSRWMIPVNIREHADQQVAPGMHSSYFLLPYNVDFKIEDVHREMKAQLQSGIHWANYYLGWVLAQLPKDLIFWLTERDFKKSTSDIVGSFSNLGSWRNLDEDLKAYSWAMFPTVRAHRPFAITVIQWGERFTFAMRLHDSIEQSEVKLDLFREELQKNLQEMSQS